MRYNYLWVVTILGLVIENIEEGLCGTWTDWITIESAVGGTSTKQITRLYQRGNELGVTQGSYGRIPCINWMQNRPLPVSILVNDSKKDFR